MYYVYYIGTMEKQKSFQEKGKNLELECQFSSKNV